jgi:hypothetical protein
MKVKTTYKLYLGNSIEGEKFTHFIDIKKDIFFGGDRQIAYFVSMKAIGSIFEVNYNHFRLNLDFVSFNAIGEIFKDLKQLK